MHQVLLKRWLRIESSKILFIPVGSKLLLREWMSIALVTGNALAFGQSAAAQAAINAIELTIGEAD